MRLPIGRLALLSLAAALCAPLAAAPLRVGWASVDITPAQPVALAGQFYTRISKFVHDPVTATALALEAGGEQAIVVSVDVVVIDRRLPEAVRARLKSELPEFDPRKLIVNATHTHTAPEMREGRYEVPEGVMNASEFLAFLTGKLTGAAVRAWKARQPAGVSWALGHAVIGHNRRAFFAGGKSIMTVNLNRPDFLHIEGYEDHGLELLFFWTPKRRLTGIGINVAGPAQVVSNQYYVSADFWDDARKELRRRFGQDLFVLPLAGASGDQGPHPLVRGSAEAKMRERLGISRTMQIGRRITAAVEEVYPAAEASIRTGVPFVHRVEELKLPVRMVTPAELEWARAEYARLEKAADRSLFRRMVWARDVIERYSAQERVRHFPIELHVMRLGDVALATNPFELFLDYGLRMKARSRAEQTFVVQLACDSAGYLPTAKAVAAGGYGAEIASNLVGPEGGQALVDRTVDLINSLFE